eukprot:353764-Chlamydomonas_euryale.AAC.1
MSALWCDWFSNKCSMLVIGRVMSALWCDVPLVSVRGAGCFGHRGYRKRLAHVTAVGGRYSGAHRLSARPFYRPPAWRCGRRRWWRRQLRMQPSLGSNGTAQWGSNHIKVDACKARGCHLLSHVEPPSPPCQAHQSHASAWAGIQKLRA